MNRYSHKKTTSYKRNTRIIITCIITSIITLIALKQSKKQTTLLNLPEVIHTPAMLPFNTMPKPKIVLPSQDNVLLEPIPMAQEPIIQEPLLEKKAITKVEHKKATVEKEPAPEQTVIDKTQKQDLLEFDAPLILEESSEKNEPKAIPDIELLEKALAPDEKINEKHVVVYPGDINLKYKHWSGTYKPTDFTLLINNHSIDPQNKDIVRIPLHGDTITAEFSWDFMNGYKTGKRTTVWQVDPESSDHEISFNWKSDTKISFKNAKCIKVE